MVYLKNAYFYIEILIMSYFTYLSRNIASCIKKLVILFYKMNKNQNKILLFWRFLIVL